MSNLKLRLNQPGRISVELYNIVGKKPVTLSDEFLNAGEQMIPPDMRDLSKGNYFLKLDSAAGLKVIPLVKICNSEFVSCNDNTLIKK